MNKNPNNTDDLWTHNETKLLLSVIVEKNIMKLFKNTSYKRANVLQIIENEFHKCGITNKNTLLIDNKWKDLIKMYKFTVKTNVDIVSRGGIPLTCYYYEELDKILAPKILPKTTKSVNVESTNIQLNPVQHSTVSKSDPKKCGEIMYVDGQLKYLCFLCPHNDESEQTFEEHFYSNHLKKLIDNCNSIKLNNGNSGCDKSATYSSLAQPAEPLMFEMLEIKDELQNFPEIVTTQINNCKIADTVPKELHKNDHQEDNFNCDFCSMSFPTESRMINHREWFKDHRKYCFECNIPICGRQKYTKHNYQFHNKNITLIGPTSSYECYMCKKTCKNISNLYLHLRLHNGVRAHKCTECDMAFAAKSSLTMHIRHHHTFERPFMCTECGACFAFQRILNAHVRRHRQQEESPKPCPICSKIIKNSERLQIHLKIHTDERNFICKVCDRTFKTRRSYRQHLLIHSEERKFPCQFCDLSFAQAAGRRGHVRRVHEGIK